MKQIRIITFLFLLVSYVLICTGIDNYIVGRYIAIVGVYAIMSILIEMKNEIIKAIKSNHDEIFKESN